jgi:Terminase RNaseH-like domain/Terminase large subunit, T4likevirus-type, N-terminal
MYSSTSPKQLNAELTELERRMLGPKIDIPDTYEQFAAGLVIRSGGQQKQMRLYQYQRAISALLARYPTVMLCKTRQTGLSQQAATTLLYDAARNKAFNSIFFSLTNQDLSSISKRIGEAIATNRWRIKSETDNVTLLKVLNGGQVGFRSYGGKSAARGVDSASTLVFDECAWADNLADLMGAAAASTVLVEQPNFIFITTPSTPGCTYYGMLEDTLAPLGVEEVCEAVIAHKLYSFGIPGFMHVPAKDGKSCVVLIHWSAHPVFRSRPNFLAERQAIEKTSIRVINREYGLQWQSSAGSYFTTAQIAKVCILPPIGRAPKKDPRFTVVIGIDPAGGAQKTSKKKSPDYCIGFILLRNEITREVTQVGLYRDNKLDSAAHIRNLEQLITIWQPNRVCCETNGLGGVFFSALKHKFPQLDLVPFNTTGKKKVTGYGRVTFLIENGQLAIWNSPTIKGELLNLQDDGKGNIEAPPLMHDDIPMGLLLAVHALQAVDDENAD